MGKFRVWDSEIKAMITSDNSDQFAIGLNGIFIDIGCKFTSQIKEVTKAVTIEKLIDRKDKNGKDLFIGDILRCNTSNCIENEEVKVIKDEGVRGVYPFNEPLDYDPTDDDYLKSCEVELIGNIHENSDLIIPGEIIDPEPVDPVIHVIKATSKYNSESK